VAADDLTKCLRSAVDTLATVQGLDDEMRAEIIRRLQEVVKKERRSPEARIVSVEQALRSARRDVIQAAVARQKQEEKLLQFATDTRFSYGSTIESIRDAADNLKRFIAPDIGNKGDAVEGSLTSALRFELRELQGKLEPVFRFIADTRGVIRDSEMAVAFHKEAVGMDSGNAQAEEMVRVFRESFKPYLERLREAGIWVDETDNWFFQSHDFRAISNSADEWRAFMRDNLDTDKHPDPDATIEALYNSLVDRDIVEQTGGRVGMQRVIQFRSPEAQHEYFLRFGDGQGNVAYNVLSSVFKITSETVIAERLGPNGLATLTKVGDQIKNAAAKASTNERAVNRIKSRINRAQNVMKFMAQPPTKPEHQGIENFMSGLRLSAVGTFLGKTALSMVGEEPILSTMFGRMASGGYWRSFTGRLSRVAELLDKEGALRQFAEAHGLWQNALAAQNAARQFADPAAGRASTGGGRFERFRNVAAQYATITQRYTGTVWMEQAQRSASFATIHDGVTRNFDRGWGDLGPQFREYILERNGITKRDWESLRKTDTNNELGFLDVDGLRTRNLPLYRKYMTMVVREAEIQNNLPDAESLMIIQGVSDSLGSRLARQQVTQFFGWALSVQRNGVAREMQSGVIPGTIAAGASLAAAAVTLQLYALAAGQPMYEFDSNTLWWRALTRSAFLGPFIPAGIDFVGLDVNADGVSVGGRGSGSIPGVVPSTVSSVAQGVFRTAVDGGSGDGEAALAEAIKTGAYALPNWWYVDALTTKATDAMIFSLEPEQLRRRNRRWEKEERMGQ
jgi:hypothetical protein